MPKLTKTMVDNTAPAEKDVWLWDTELQGFGVRVRPSGRKMYVVRYRVRDSKGTQRKQHVARCSDMPPDKARELARKIFCTVAEGGDPLQERREIKESPTVEDLQERFMREHARPFKKPRSVDHDESRFRVHIIPALGKKRVRDVTKADVLAFFGSLSESPAVANQCLAVLSKAFNLAEDWDWRPRNSNPCQRIKRFKLKARELILTPEQIRNLNDTLTAMVAADKIQQAMADLVRLLILQGCRLREIMHAKTAWIDRERNLLLLPDSKVGQRKIPLSAASLAIVDAMPKGQEWLIPGNAPGRPMDCPYKAWNRIKKAAGLPKELRIHDMRHTAGSLGHMAGLSQKQIADMLGHHQLSTTERYLHGVTGDKAAVAEKMGNVIVGAWAGSKAVA